MQTGWYFQTTEPSAHPMTVNLWWLYLVLLMNLKRIMIYNLQSLLWSRINYKNLRAHGKIILRKYAEWGLMVIVKLVRIERLSLRPWSSIAIPLIKNECFQGCESRMDLISPGSKDAPGIALFEWGYFCFFPIQTALLIFIIYFKAFS